jgi:hypothetical protein
MAKRFPNDGLAWTKMQQATLRKLAKTGTAAAAAKTLGRTPEATQQKAMRLGISFRATRRPAKKK